MSEKIVRELRRRMEAMHLDKKTLSVRAGLGESYVRDLFSGKSKNPTASKLGRLAKVLGCATADITGERSVRHAQVGAADVITINELDVYAPSGDGGDGERGNAIMANEEADQIVGVHTMPAASYREAYGVPASRIKIIPVKGNSMAPALWPGQRVMVDVKDQTPSPPGIFVIWDGLALVLKYVEVVANSEPLRVRISSANPAFQPYERLASESYINGRVIGVWARM